MGLRDSPGEWDMQLSLRTTVLSSGRLLWCLRLLSLEIPGPATGPAPGCYTGSQEILRSTKWAELPSCLLRDRKLAALSLSLARSVLKLFSSGFPGAGVVGAAAAMPVRLTDCSRDVHCCKQSSFPWLWLNEADWKVLWIDVEGLFHMGSHWSRTITCGEQIRKCWRTDVRERAQIHRAKRAGSQIFQCLMALPCFSISAATAITIS